MFAESIIDTIQKHDEFFEPVASNVGHEQVNLFRRAVERARGGPLAGRWLFAWVLLAQLGHVIEHIAKQLTGSGVLGSGFDSELSHLVFNGAIAILSMLLVAVYTRNPWVYPLAVLSIGHGIEHVYIFNEFLKTGVSDGPGLLGRGGAIGLIPLDRLDLHNVYNGLEMILIVLGFGYETEALLEAGESDAKTRSSD